MKKDLKNSKLTTLEKAKAVGITIKKLKTLQGRDGLAFTAEVYLNGVLLAHARDDGNGGMMDIDAAFKRDDFDEMRANRKIIQEVETKLAKYPEYEIEAFGHTYKSKDDLEMIINALVDDVETQKQFNRDKKKGVLFGDSIIKWKVGSIPVMIKSFGIDRTLPLLQKECDKLKEKNIEVLNKEYLEELGVKF